MRLVMADVEIVELAAIVVADQPRGLLEMGGRGPLNAERARGLSAYAISPAAAAPLAGLPFMRVDVAPRPDETALLSMIAG